MHYMGIDHHKQYSHITVMDEDGRELKSGRVWNVSHEIEAFLEGKGPHTRAVIEAGRTSYVMVDLLRDIGVDVHIAHPSEVKAIAKAKIKTDKRDSRILAHLLRTDLIPEVFVRDEKNRRIQRILRHRAFYVGTRTRVKNKIRVLLAQQKLEIQEKPLGVKNIFCQKGRVAMKALNLPTTDKNLLDSLLKIYEHLEERVKESDALIEESSSRLPDAQLIRSVPGFGAFLSVLVATEIADVKRFESPAKLHAYAGLIPSTHSSGQTSYHGKIVKAGNAWLRWAAVEAVHPACQRDSELLVFFQKRARKKGPNVARIATARRLLTIIYQILRDRRNFIPYKRLDDKKRKVAFQAS